ncbi:MAG: hypothetical protein GY874_22460 [Desulfobacteraceae bacterium]|nr:hypothetical protein [Desulfobacteraceae bacterium]
MAASAKQTFEFRAPLLNKTITMEKWQSCFLAFFIFMGLTARLRNYLADISLWSDEAKLANNLVALNFGRLLGPLSEKQVAPIGFCLVEKLLLAGWANHEMSLRAVPFIAGSAAIILAFIFVYRVLGPVPAILCAAQLAVIKEAIFFANDLKPYASDLAIALALANLAWSKTLPLLSRKRYWTLLIAGIIAVWFSFPALFVLGAIGITYLIKLIIQRRWKVTVPLVAMGGAWLFSFAVQYCLLTSDGGNDGIMSAWTNRFIILLPASLNDLAHNWYFIYDAFRDPLWTSHPIISLPLYFSGCYLLWRKNAYFLFFILLPLVLNLFSSGLHAYPFQGRLLQYGTVFLFIPIAYSLSRLLVCQSRYNWVKWAAVLMIAANLAEPSVNVVRRIVTPRRYEEMKPVVTYIKAKKNAEDGFFVHANAIYTFTYYSERFEMEHRRLTLSHRAAESKPHFFDNEIRTLFGRVWLVFGNAKQFKGKDFELTYLKIADKYGKQIDRYIDQGAAAYLYVFP